MWVNVLLAGTGGFAGAAARYLSTYFFVAFFHAAPWLGTLAVNCAGSAAAGAFMAVPSGSAVFSLRILLVTGFLGGFTTFSAFSAETLAFFRAGNVFMGAANIFLNVFLSIGAACLGFAVIRMAAGRL